MSEPLLLETYGKEKDDVKPGDWTARLENGVDVGTWSGPTQTNLGDEVKWTVPNDLPNGTKVVLTVKKEDQGLFNADLSTPDSSRDDAPWVGHVEVVISSGPIISDIVISPDKPTTSGANNTPASEIVFSPIFTDSQNAIQSVAWTCGALGDYVSTNRENRFKWALNPVPFNAEHKEYTVTCTIYWVNGQDSTERKFKLFFEKQAKDEDLSTAKGFKDDKDFEPASPPNWYDHWKQLIPGLGDMYYFKKTGVSYNEVAGSFSPHPQKNLPAGHLIITDTAASSGYSMLNYPYHRYGSGIDSCGMVVLHEHAHKKLHEDSWGGYDDAHIGPNGAWLKDPAAGFDRDADGIKDSWEQDVWMQPEFDEMDQTHWKEQRYWRNFQYNGIRLQEDHEFNADMKAYDWVIGSLDSQDWSKPGKQADLPF